MKLCGIYKITNKINGKFYIGSSCDIQRRWRDGHVNILNKGKHDNQHLQNAWNKYGKDSFSLDVYKKCDPSELLTEEQKELDVWVGKKECYNMRKDAKCPTAPGEKRPAWVVKKYADAQRGKPRWTEEQKKQMSIDRLGRNHKPETKQKMLGRKTSFENIAKAQMYNVNRIYPSIHCQNISEGKKNKHKIFTEEEKKRIGDGIKKAILDGRYVRNKISLSEYETIKSLYLYDNMNQRRLSFKYGVNPNTMNKILKKIGVK